MFRLTLSDPPFSAEVFYTGTGVLAQVSENCHSGGVEHPKAQDDEESGGLGLFRITFTAGGTASGSHRTCYPYFPVNFIKLFLA
jgi:hypothetical protein